MFTHVWRCSSILFSNFRLHYSILGINRDTVTQTACTAAFWCFSSDLQKPLLVTLLYHVLHRRKLCSRLWIVGPHLVRFEVCCFVCPIKEHSVPAGRNWSNLYYPNTWFWRFCLPNRSLEVMAATLPGHGAWPFTLPKIGAPGSNFCLTMLELREDVTNLKLETFEVSPFIPRIE